MPPKLETDPGSEPPKVEAKKYPRLRRVGVYVVKTACLGFMVGAGVFGAIELQ